ACQPSPSSASSPGAELPAMVSRDRPNSRHAATLAPAIAPAWSANTIPTGMLSIPMANGTTDTSSRESAFPACAIGRQWGRPWVADNTTQHHKGDRILARDRGDMVGLVCTMPSLDRAAIDPDADRVVRKLTRAGYKAYLVGGCVRDLLVARTPKDFDVATSATP